MRVASNKRQESFEQWRKSMLEETARFIEWGLEHPEQVEWIPRHRVNQGHFPERVKVLFWSLIFQNPHLPD